MVYRYLNITYDCQCSCLFCVADIPLRRIRSSMSFRELVAVALAASPGDTYVLSGGEPTLHPGLLPFIRLVADRRARTVLQTNGLHLGDSVYTRELTEAGVSEIGIPLHGSSAEVHDSLVGYSGAFEVTLRAIRNVMALKSEPRRPHLEVKLLISRPTLNELPRIIEMLPEAQASPDSVVLKFMVESLWTQDNAARLSLSFVEAAETVSEAVLKLEARQQDYWLAGFPICALSYEARLAASRRHESRGLDFKNTSMAEYYDPEFCAGDEEAMEGTRDLCPLFGECGMKESCPGPEPTYVTLHGVGELKAC